MKALIIVDMLNDFVLPTGALYCGPTIDPIVQLIKMRLKAAEADPEENLIIYLADAHAEDDIEFERFPKHAVRGTEGAQIVSDVMTDGPAFIIEKTRYSGFYDTDLGALLRLYGVDEEVTVVGCCTSICVMDTVGDLANRDYKIVVPAAEVADFDADAHAAALKRMEVLYGAAIV